MKHVRCVCFRRFVPLAFASALGCSSSSKTGGEPPADVGNDTAHDASVQDTQLPDSTKDGTDDAIDSGAKDSSTTDGTDSSADSIADASADAAPDAALDSGIDGGGDAPLDVTDTLFDAVTTPYRHTILIDGVDDFTASSEKFSTTSTSYDAYVTWDATTLYVGYSGPDVSTSTASGNTKWLFAYLDVDPGAGTGATMGVQYNHQRPGFLSGFGAEYYLRWKADGSYATFDSYAGTTWSTSQTYGSATKTWSGSAAAITSAQSGTYIEFAIPLAALGTPPATLGVITLWMNEAPGGEFTYAGLYSASFTEGYFAYPPAVPISKYLLADFATSPAPNNPSRRRP